MGEHKNTIRISSDYHTQEFDFDNDLLYYFNFYKCKLTIPGHEPIPFPYSSSVKIEIIQKENVPAHKKKDEKNQKILQRLISGKIAERIANRIQNNIDNVDLDDNEDENEPEPPQKKSRQDVQVQDQDQDEIEHENKHTVSLQNKQERLYDKVAKHFHNLIDNTKPILPYSAANWELLNASIRDHFNETSPTLDIAAVRHGKLIRYYENQVSKDL